MPTMKLETTETIRELADAELDAVSAGQASAQLFITGIGASGPNSASAAVFDLFVNATTTATASTAAVSGNFFASSS